ncbi:MAG: hypothetical protein HKN01_01510 [Acidimicrobiia bacterium]|nr:hypothetical protein [Acidimicrobiia bacterium]
MLLDQFIERAQVVLGSAVTWIAATVAVLQFVLTQDVVLATPELADWIGQAITTLLGVLAVIRRVSPVPVSQRGLV